MIGRIATTLRRLIKSEDGSAVVPFALWMPVMLGIGLSTIEVGAMTLRHTQLERAMDLTVRDVRLGTGHTYTHAQLKQMICDRTTILGNCATMLHLEMIGLDLRDWTDPPSSIECTDLALDVTPQRNFQFGQEHEAMLLRACYKYRPITLVSRIGSPVKVDEHGFTGVVSTATFVYEPM
ncbi:TadE/TadG family type IV pilus assembly protein [Salipiger bermudensis]|uniref:TadE/TadG family type IV pilus assembly protein n=1 Tax=Salipiger bermudensis TaxID=344736 RepID=UPI001CD4C9B1|nr:TadE family protein [Salipiger bermudensis]MCA0964284.1 pilus assembly protein [Salipiger bermudensis]